MRSLLLTTAYCRADHRYSTLRLLLCQRHRRQRRLHMPRMTKELCAENSQQASISTLRNAAAPVFAKEGFRNIAWAGVFGSFARGEQKDSSDVDVIVVWDPAHKVGWYPPNNIFWLDIAEELEKVWGREVDVIDIRRGRIRTYVDVEALLSSRTLHGSETNPHVVKARRDASEVLETGFTLYGDISIKIKGTRASITGKSFEDFTASEDLRQTIQDRVFSILSDLDIQPPANPYRSRFSNTIFYPAQMLTHDLQQKKALPGNDDPSSAYWSAIWDAVSDTTPSAHNLHNFDLWIRVHVFGGLRFTKELGERVQKLGEEEDGAVSALVQSADETWYAYVRGWIAWLFFYQGGRNGRLF